jgi:hypothetical protein
MTAQIDNLHKILKDQTRRNIILLLNNKSALTYTGLMEEMGFTTTGLLNYHLKALGDLLVKNEAGQYSLSEKGKVASRLLLEFPEPTPKQVKLKPKWWGTFWKSVSIAFAISLAINTVLYYYGWFSLQQFIQQGALAVGGLGIAYMLKHIGEEIISAKTKRKLARICYIAVGMSGFGFLFWLAVWKLLVVTNVFGGGLLSGPMEDITTWVIFFTGYILGAFIGNWAGKKMHYRLPGSFFRF